MSLLSLLMSGRGGAGGAALRVSVQKSLRGAGARGRGQARVAASPSACPVRTPPDDSFGGRGAKGGSRRGVLRPLRLLFRGSPRLAQEHLPRRAGKSPETERNSIA